MQIHLLVSFPPNRDELLYFLFGIVVTSAFLCFSTEKTYKKTALIIAFGISAVIIFISTVIW